MKTASVKELKNELEYLDLKQLVSITLRLAKFKKENKELLTYLLFEAANEQDYVNNVKQLLHIMFTEVNIKNLYFTRKNLRKIVRTTNRYIRYSEEPATEIDLLIFVCREIGQLEINISKSTVLVNLYNGLIKKIKKAISELHEDLQYDYSRDMEKLQLL